MSAATDFGENLLMKVALGITPVANRFLALHTADPTETGNIAELTGGSYARVAVTFQEVSAGSSNGRNIALLRFDGLPAATITHFCLWDAATGGNPLVKDALGASQTVLANQPLEFAAGALIVEVQ